MTEQLYATIAGIVGVWLSAVVSLCLALFTYIFTQNINYFKSLREEKRKLFLCVTDHDITFSGSLSNERAHENCIRNLSLIREKIKQSKDEIKQSKDEIKQSKDEIRDNLSKNVLEIFEIIKKIIYSYPYPEELSRFLLTEDMLTEDDGYKPWLENYRNRIDYSLMEKTFKELDTYLNNIKRNGLATDDIQLKITKIKNVMNKLRYIESSINTIYTLKRDYKPIDTIIKIIKSELTLFYVLGTLFFGVLLPVYMLLPTQLHINLISECWVIGGIFAGSFVCITGTIHMMVQIANSIIRK